MPMTVVISRDVEARYRGFLASVMLEVAPGVYVSPDLSASVRDRVWDVIAKWHATLQRGSLVMVWRNNKAPGGLSLRHRGDPPKEIYDADGVLLVRNL